MRFRPLNPTAVILFATLTSIPIVRAAPLGTAITYQGQLKQGGLPVTGSFIMEFRLYDAASGGNLIGTQTINPVTVTSGLFTVQLNDTGQYGPNAFNSDARWLEIWVNGVMLTPRQQIAAAPYANALRLPLAETIAGSGDIFSLTNSGSNGSAGVFSVTGFGNLSPALQATSGGVAPALVANSQTGTAVSGTANLGRAGSFQSSGSFPTLIVTNTTSNGTAMSITGNVGIGQSSPVARLEVAGGGSTGLSLNVDGHLYVNDQTGFVGVNRSTTIGSEYFGVRATTGANTYGGMYIETTDAAGWPFYGYATNGSARAWTYYNGSTGDWSLYNAGVKLTVQSGGNVGIGVTSPGRALDVLGRIRLRQDLPASSGNSAGIDFYQQTPAADRAFIGMRTDDQIGLYGRGGSGWSFVMDVNNGNVGIGTTAPAVALDVSGTVRCDVLEINGADVAEKFPSSDKPEPGTVMEIDPDHAGQLRIARGAYNSRVAGVVSGANDFPAGTILGNKRGGENMSPVALSGRVFVRCDASQAAIEIGDLLTTSDSPGRAMKAVDRERTYGAVIGKAMTPLARGRSGLVLVLVSLQ